MIRRLIRHHRLAIVHPLRIVSLVGKQERSAPQGLETTHVAPIRARHVDGAVEHDLGRRQYVIVVAAEDRVGCERPHGRRPSGVLPTARPIGSAPPPACTGANDPDETQYYIHWPCLRPLREPPIAA